MSLSSKGILGIGIETSCDETSVAVVKNGRELLSNIIYSQIPEHAPFRGVVPEIAGRSHLQKINGIFEQALSEASVTAEKLDYIAVTNRPGLIGSLMMGGLLAKSLHLVYGIPLVTIDHLEAHLYAVALERDLPTYPFLGLLLSGGNSAIYRIDGPGEMTCVADTTDDALGEAYDKVASVLSLPYPGGPYVEKSAGLWTNRDLKSLFPLLMRNRPSTDMRFSFSGIKTAVLRAARAGEDIHRICYDFQETVFELVERILLRAVKKTGINSIIASGGVLANGNLRDRLNQMGKSHRIDVYFPGSKTLCTDNGAMVAACGFHHFNDQNLAASNYNVFSRR